MECVDHLKPLDFEGKNHSGFSTRAQDGRSFTLYGTRRQIQDQDRLPTVYTGGWGGCIGFQEG